MQLKLGDIGTCEQCKRPNSMVIPIEEKMVCFVCAEMNEEYRLKTLRKAIETDYSDRHDSVMQNISQEDLRWLIQNLDKKEGDEMETVQIKPWETVKFSWGVGVRHRRGEWETLIFSNGAELDVRGMNIILHDNGIEFY